MQALLPLHHPPCLPLQPRSSRGAVEWFLPKPAIWLDISRFSIRCLNHQFECICAPASKGVHHTGASWPDACFSVHEATDVLTIPGNREGRYATQRVSE